MDTFLSKNLTLFVSFFLTRKVPQKYPWTGTQIAGDGLRARGGLGVYPGVYPQTVQVPPNRLEGGLGVPGYTPGPRAQSQRFSGTSPGYFGPRFQGVYPPGNGVPGGYTGMPVYPPPGHVQDVSGTGFCDTWKRCPEHVPNTMLY